MKILFIHPSVELYGADKILLYILDLLHNDNDLTVMLPKRGVLCDEINKISKKIKIEIFQDLPIVHSKLLIKDYFYLLKRVNLTSKYCNSKKYDMIYCNTLASVLLLFMKCKGNKIIHVHEIIENKLLNFCFSILIKMGAKKVICVSEHVRKNLFFSKKYKVVHNGIPDLCKKNQENFVKNKVKFVLPGRFMPKKGQWFLIDTLRELPKEILNQCEFYFYGSPPPNRLELGEELLHCIVNNNLEDYIHVKGFTQNISDIYEDANVILVPSIMKDPFPTTVLEALMFSKPVISTNHGGASEILNEEYSQLISPNNIDDFKKAIVFLVEKKELLNVMSINARNYFEKELTVNTFKKHLLKEIL